MMNRRLFLKSAAIIAATIAAPNTAFSFVNGALKKQKTVVEEKGEWKEFWWGEWFVEKTPKDLQKSALHIWRNTIEYHKAKGFKNLTYSYEWHPRRQAYLHVWKAELLV